MQNLIKWILLLALFAPILYFSLRQKKWYLYLLMAFTAILPEQFSVSLHEKLPLITASRILIVIAAAFWLVQRIQARNFRIPVALAVFLGINLAIAVFHLFWDLDEINRIFLFVMERGLVVVMLVDMITSREEFDRCVDFMILGCISLTVMAICQTVFDYDIASVLHLRETITSAMVSDRMGLVRAYATKNAITYGAYAAFMVLPIYYRMQGTGKQRYSIAFALNLVALFATFTRSAWLCIIGVGGLVFLTQPVKMLKTLWTSVVMVVVLCVAFSFIQPKFGTALSETAKSSVNTVLRVLPSDWFHTTQQELPSDTTPEETEPDEPGFDLSDEFGDNANNPTYSRLFQWSAVKYMAQDGHLLLGHGYNAFRQGQIYFTHKNWGDDYRVAPVLDVGFVSMIAESGLVGLLTYLGMLGYMMVQSLRKTRKGTFDFYKVMIFSIIMYLLLNFLSAFVNIELAWLMFGLFYTYEALDKKDALREVPALPEKKWEF
jgi:hypothetical protein